MGTHKTSMATKTATALLSGMSLLLLSSFAPARALTHDPTQDPLPTDFVGISRTVVVNIEFHEWQPPETKSINVVRLPNSARAGNAPFLSVELRDLGDNIVEQFNAWDPRTLHAVGPGSGDITLADAPGMFSFPFRVDAAAMVVTETASHQQLASVDLLPPLHAFCRANGDPDCSQMANRNPTCIAGGPYSIECAGATTALALDGSRCSDLDQDPLGFAWTGPFVGGSASGVSPTVQFPGYGDFTVDLRVTDDFAGSATCRAPVTVTDSRAPVIQCNNPSTIRPPNAPITFVASAADACTGEVGATIAAYDCFTFTSKGKRVDKRESCKVGISGDRITIYDSGGVGDHITWDVVSTDASGNRASRRFETVVVR